MEMEIIPEQFLTGVDQFNNRQFYACHDTLEALWIDAMEPEKTFYQGVLQIAVALYHLGNNNWRGAVILLGEGRNRLRRYPSAFSGVDVDGLLDDSGVLLAELQKIAPEQIAAFNFNEYDSLSVPKIVLVDQESE